MRRLICGWWVLTACLAAGVAAAQAQERGKPWARHTIDGASRGADGVKLADVNRDGLPDIVTGWEEGGVVRLYVNPGPAKAQQAWPVVAVGRAPNVEDAVFCDVDGDGAVDAVSCCEGRTRTMFVHWAPAKPSDYMDASKWVTEAIPASRDLMQWMFAMAMQVDGRHGPDLIAGGKNAAAKVGWFEAPANPRNLAEWKWHPLSDAGWIMSLVLADMDADGKTDILLSDRHGPLRGCRWLKNTGPEKAAEQWTNHFIGGRDREAMFLALADLDGDGLADVVNAVKDKATPGTFDFHRRTASPANEWKTFPIAMAPNMGSGKGAAVGDIDLDGRPDIVISCEHANPPKSGVLWFSCPGKPADGPWTAHEISGPQGTKYDLVVLMDMDADGDLDVLTCEEVENLGVFWYENPTRGDPAPGQAAPQK